MKPASRISPLLCLCMACMLVLTRVRADDKPPAAPAPGQSVNKELAPITVPAQRNPLDRSDKHLHALQKSLPGTGKKPKKGFSDWYAKHDDPNKMSASRKQMVQNMNGKDQSNLPSDLQLQRP